MPVRLMLAAVLAAPLAASAPAPAPAPRPAALAGFARPASVPYPARNGWTAAKAVLGERLFRDTALSSTGTVSCATCHVEGKGWSDGRPRAVGVKGSDLPLRSPPVQDLAWSTRLGWDGKFKDLEAVTFAPLTNPANMGLTEAEAVRRVSADASYGAMFEAAFGDAAVDRRRMEDAVATYERTIVSRPSAFDAWVDGDDHAVGAAARRGFGLFAGKAGCSSCHSGWNMTDGSFQDIGSATGDDRGRGKAWPASPGLQYAFKVPGLRGVSLRGPFMHDGSVATLRDVVDLYDRGGIDRPSRPQSIHPLGLTPAEKDDLVAFLGTL